MSIPPSKDGTCPFKRDETHDCCGCSISGPIVCNWLDEANRSEHCSRFFREAALNDIIPKAFCCTAMQNLFHGSAESTGYYRGCFDIVKHPNDGHLVMRNMERAQFTFCPFCGTKLV